MLTFGRSLFLVFGSWLLISTGLLVGLRQQDPTTRLIIEHERGRGSEFYLITPDGTEKYPLVRITRHAEYRGITPDGSQLLFYGHMDDSRGHSLFSVPVRGGAPQKLMAGPEGYAAFTNPLFSPDGKHLFIPSNNATINSSLYIFSTSGDYAPRPLDIGLDIRWDWAIERRWSPDNETIIFGSPQDHAIYSIGADGANLQKLATGELFWSHINDDWLFFRDKELYRMRLDGTERQLITHTDPDREVRPLVLSDDRAWLIFEAVKGDDQEIYRVRLDGSDQERLFHFTELRDVIMLSPENDWLLLRTPSSGTRIFSAENAYVNRFSNVPTYLHKAFLDDGRLEDFASFDEEGTQLLGVYRIEDWLVAYQLNGIERYPAANSSGFQTLRLNFDGSPAERLTADDEQLLDISADGEWSILLKSPISTNDSYLIRRHLQNQTVQNITDPTQNSLYRGEYTVPEMGWKPALVTLVGAVLFGLSWLPFPLKKG